MTSTLVILLVALIWFMFSLLYFSREVSDFVNGRGRKPSLPPSVANVENVENKSVFGGSKTNAATFFAGEDENNNDIKIKIGDYNKNIATFAEESRQAQASDEEEGDFGDDFDDLTGMFDLEFGSNDGGDDDDDDDDSGDVASGEENLGAAKTLGELKAETLNLLKVIGGDGSDAGVEEKLQASETLRELEGTDLFSQVETASGGSARVELMRLELDKLWNEMYEMG